MVRRCLLVEKLARVTVISPVEPLTILTGCVCVPPPALVTVTDGGGAGRFGTTNDPPVSGPKIELLKAAPVLELAVTNSIWAAGI
jgi:hypothetical protein